MSRLISALCLFSFFAGFAQAGEGDVKAIENCLQHWGKHPFAKTDPEFRVLGAKVKVFGIGDDVSDEKQTAKPELILVKPNVNVMGKATLNLLNPNGWYCLKAKIAVMGKTVINLHCKASLASNGDGATVLGGADEQNGVTVLGASQLNRVECHGNAP